MAARALFLTATCALALGFSSFTAHAQDAGRVRALQQAAALAEGDVKPLIQLAELYRKSGKAGQAVAVMREAQKRKPDDERVLAHLGYALIADKQYEAAVEAFDMLTAVNHESAVGFNGKGVAFDHAGNHVAAQEIYQQGLRVAPHSPTLKNNLALSYVMNQQYEEAITLLEPMAGDPGAPDTVRHNLALAYGAKGDAARAKAIDEQYLGAAQVEQNQAFYDYYARLAKSQKAAAIAPQMEAEPAAGAVKDESPAGDDVQDEADSFWGSDVKAQYPTGGR